MDWSAAYCPTRRDMEEHGWALTARLSALTGRLIKIIGRDRKAFAALRQECGETRLAIAASHQSLREHRLEHGC